MKREETIAEGFLQKYFGKTPTYEPLGEGSTPDFCIGKCAFEVRRLNQIHVGADGKTGGLENVSIPLHRALAREFRKVPKDEAIGSYFWALSFSRPLQASVREIASILGGEAAKIYKSAPTEKISIEAHGVKIELMSASQSHDGALLFGLEDDKDSGGWVDGIYKESIEYALMEKIAKTEAIADQFEIWTLVLIDTLYMWPPDRLQIEANLAHFNCVALIDLKSKLLSDIPEGSLTLARQASSAES